MRLFVSRLSSFCCFFFAGAAAAIAAQGSRPNVLLFFTDDQQADTIAALGNPHIQTPNLDRLVRSGVSFRRAYMMGGMQGATCVPSRAMLLSGQNLFRIDEKLLRDETWPAAFGRAGYTTFMSGKWHNSTPSLPKSFQRAGAVFTGGMTNPMQAKLSRLENGQVTPAELSPVHACAAFADSAVAFLREPHAQPFLCYLPFDGPHDPHIVPDDFPVHYDPATIPLPPNFMPQHPFNNGEMTIRDEQLMPWPRPENLTRQMIADYYRYISYLDMLMGRVLAALDASPAAKNTLIAFTSDSGVARGRHGLIGKQNVYEHSVRVPLIVSGPGLPAQRTTDAMVYLFDLMPTLGALCGVAAPPASEGIDFSATLRDPRAPARPALMFAYRNVQRGYRDERWKLIRYPQVDRTQLFDLQSDPNELTDLSAQPAQAARVTAMSQALAAEMKRFGDTDSLTVPNPQSGAWNPPVKQAGKGKNF